jgi:leucyl aminopeptidase (aminopeptidase T)
LISINGNPIRKKDYMESLSDFETEQNKDFSMGPIIKRREFLKKSGRTALVVGGMLEFLLACTEMNPKQGGPSTTPMVSQLKDEAIDNIFRISLEVKKDERVLVFTDDYKSLVAGEAEYVAKRGAHFAQILFFKYPSTGLPGVEPPKSLWEKAFGKYIVTEIERIKLMEKLLEKKISDEELESIQEIVRKNRKDVVQVVIALAWNSTTHTSFRKLLTRSAGVRYASMPAFDPRMWQTAMSANWEQVAQRTLVLKDKLSGAVSAHVRTSNGTDISFDLKDRVFSPDTGLLNKPGRSGNLPAGELSIAPVEGRSNGKLVVEPGVNPGVRSRMILEIKDGAVFRMSGDTYYISWLEKIFTKYPLARNIAEFAIGTNEKAKTGTTMLELEKILGTIHVAIGDNSTMGGKTLVPFHVDFLFENPTVEVKLSDGGTPRILETGKPLW